MLLAIDIGNSNISVGLFDKARELRFLASLDTDSRKTADQISIDLMNLFTLYGCDIHDVSGAIFASVVPPINFMMEKALTRLLGKPPMMVGAGIKTGLNIRMEFNSQQLGADIVSNAVAALEKYPAPIIMIDMGTATIISYISAKRCYEGGLMFPGVRLSLDALSDHTAQLPNISLQHPRHLIGKNTEDCIRHCRHAGRHHRPHPRHAGRGGAVHRSHRSQRTGDRTLLPQPRHLRQVSDDGGPAYHL